MMVGFVFIEMGSQMIDPLGDQRDLNRGAPTVGRVNLVLLDHFLSRFGAHTGHDVARSPWFLARRRSPPVRGCSLFLRP
jgi:hypothetical protein